jgi:transcriptional regulator with XRE-family HTH domain
MTEIEFRRQQRGLSQYQLASMIGRSLGQLANALRGHDPVAKAVNRLPAMACPVID